MTMRRNPPLLRLNGLWNRRTNESTHFNPIIVLRCSLSRPTALHAVTDADWSEAAQRPTMDALDNAGH